MKTVIATALGLSLLVSGLAAAAPAAGPQSRPAPAPVHGQPAPVRQALPAPAFTNSHAVPAPRSVAKAPLVTPQHRVHLKGERLQANHRGVPVGNPRAKGLRTPARGQEWRLLEGRYLLISSVTGTIIDIITARR